MLHVLNRELGADFDPARFEHVARWNEADQRIEMWLRSPDRQQVPRRRPGPRFVFAAGEEMLTEISTKFSPDSLEVELGECGFVVESMWFSEGDEFLLTLARPSS